MRVPRMLHACMPAFPVLRLLKNQTRRFTTIVGNIVTPIGRAVVGSVLPWGVAALPGVSVPMASLQTSTLGHKLRKQCTHQRRAPCRPSMKFVHETAQRVHQHQHQLFGRS